MPNRWFVPVPGVDPHRVKLEHVHAAFSGWFDSNVHEHDANDKPYTVSPLTDLRGQVGVEIATLTDEAERRLQSAVSGGAPVRLGNQTRAVGRPQAVLAQSWDELEACTGGSRWTLELVTPTTFRSGDRSSPLPVVSTIMTGLARSWNLWSGRENRSFDLRADGGLWVSDLDLRSTMLRLKIRQRDVHLSCVLGSLTLRCDDRETADRVAPLLRLTPYAGVGSMRGKGLGVVRLHEERASRAMARVPPKDEVRDGVAG